VGAIEVVAAHDDKGVFDMMRDGRRDSSREAADAQRSSRREILTSSLKLIGAGAVVVASTRWSTPVAAQDEGLGDGGRQGGDDGSTSSLPMAQNEGIGAGGRQGGDGGGRRRRRDDAEAPEGVGGGGRSATDPTVMAMPNTGVGIVDDAAASAAGRVAPLLLVAGAVGAASMAMKTRTMPAAISRD
jgi:hypothetical protein